MAAAAIASGAVALSDAGCDSGSRRRGGSGGNRYGDRLRRRRSRCVLRWRGGLIGGGIAGRSLVGSLVGSLVLGRFRGLRASSRRASHRRAGRIGVAAASVAVSARFLALASRSSESLRAARSAAAVSRDRRLSAAFAASSERRCELVCESAPGRARYCRRGRYCCRPARCCRPAPRNCRCRAIGRICRISTAARSGKTRWELDLLSRWTRAAFRDECWTVDQQGPGQPGSKKYQ